MSRSQQVELIAALREQSTEEFLKSLPETQSDPLRSAWRELDAISETGIMAERATIVASYGDWLGTTSQLLDQFGHKTKNDGFASALDEFVERDLALCTNGMNEEAKRRIRQKTLFLLSEYKTFVQQGVPEKWSEASEGGSLSSVTKAETGAPEAPVSETQDPMEEFINFDP